jgi:CheY-like chemotaxis protein
MNPLRVLDVDHHEVLRKGLRGLLGPRGDGRLWRRTNGREAVEEANDCRPDVVLLDLCMPELGGLETTRQILQTVPGTGILVSLKTFQNKLKKYAGLGDNGGSERRQASYGLSAFHP